PAVFAASAKPPSSVFAKASAPAPVLVSVVFAASVSASLYVCAPVVTTDPPPSAVDPGASVVRDVSAVTAPTGPPRVVTPAVFTVRFAAPSIEPAAVIAPPALLVSVTSVP